MLEHLMHESVLRQFTCRQAKIGATDDTRNTSTPHSGVLAFVEGPNDIEFLRRISRILHASDSIPISVCWRK